MADMYGIAQVSLLKAAYIKKLSQILGHTDIQRRLQSAMQILTTDATYTWKYADGQWYVTRHSPHYGDDGLPDEEYAEYVIDVAAKTCTCPDSDGRGNYCKHRLAMELLEMVAGGGTTSGYAQGQRVEYIGPDMPGLVPAMDFNSDRVLQKGMTFHVITVYEDGLLCRHEGYPIFLTVLRVSEVNAL